MVKTHHCASRSTAGSEDYSPVAPTGRHASPPDAGAGSVRPMHPADRVAQVRKWVEPTGRRASPPDAGASSVWLMHLPRGAGSAVGCAHRPSRFPA